MYRSVSVVILFMCLLQTPVMAASVSREQVEQHFRHRAEQAGIGTSGKELAEVVAALHEWREEKRHETIAEAAKKYGVAQQGRTEAEVIAAVRAAKEQRLQRAAKRAGIAVEGKTMHQLASELEARVQAK